MKASHETLCESPLHTSITLMFKGNESEITNGTHEAVNIRSINSKVASSGPYAQSLYD